MRMLNADERVALVKTRARARKRTVAKRRIASLSSACAVLLVCLVGLVASFSQLGEADVMGLYGSLVRYNQAGGYVIVALVSFAVAVAVTLGCVAYRNRSVGRIRSDGKEKDVNHD